MIAKIVLIITVALAPRSTLYEVDIAVHGQDANQGLAKRSLISRRTGR